MTTHMDRPPTVLVVDDDAFMRTLLHGVFGEAGLPVETFESARDLLDNASLAPPALLLLDVNMPGLTGIELQHLLHERGVVLPVMFLTGSSGVAEAVEAMRNGAVDFLEKPFDQAVLVKRVRRSLATGTRPTTATASQRADPNIATRLRTLTVRERAIHDWMILGKTSKEIARTLGGSSRTIETHRSRVMTKMAATTLSDLVRMSYEHPPRVVDLSGRPDAALAVVAAAT
ncbi:MAG: response regulator [Caldimonas sp.]